MGTDFELDRAEVAQGGVPPGRVVEALDVVEHIRPSLVSRATGPPGSTLGLRRLEEARHRRVVPHVAGAGHRAGYAMLGHQALEGFTRILRALIRVMQQSICLPPDARARW